MHRFYVTPDDWNPDSLVLGGTEAHHARAVLRLQSGGRVVVFNGRGHEITAEIAKITREEILVRKMYEARVPPLPCQITLAQAIPKGKNMDLIVQKAVEIGAAEVAPLISERTIVHLEAKEAAKKKRNGNRSRSKPPNNVDKTGCQRCRCQKRRKIFF